MSRYSGGGSYGHDCKKLNENWYVISWIVDYYYDSSRLRFPRTFRGNTDEVGAKKFCKKHDISLDGVEQEYTEREKRLAEKRDRISVLK